VTERRSLPSVVNSQLTTVACWSHSASRSVHSNASHGPLVSAKTWSIMESMTEWRYAVASSVQCVCPPLLHGARQRWAPRLDEPFVQGLLWKNMQYITALFSSSRNLKVLTRRYNKVQMTNKLSSFLYNSITFVYPFQLACSVSTFICIHIITEYLHQSILLKLSYDIGNSPPYTYDLAS